VSDFATKSDLAYARLRDMILAGTLAPGSVLPQGALAQQLGVSTTPLREALRRLAQQGLVDLGAHRDARVTPLDAAEARDLVELRQNLDPLAARLAAERRTTADLAAMHAALASLEALPTDPTPTQLAGHRRFHAALYGASHNQLLVESLDGLWDKTDRYRRHALASGRTDAEVADRAQEHQQLLEAVGDRDGAAAEALMARHVTGSLGARAAWRLAVEPGAPA